MEEIRLIIAGGRDFNDYRLVKTCMMSFIHEHDTAPNRITIISGMARGADLMGIEWSNEYRTELVKMPAWWRGKHNDRVYNSAAGYQRNERMAKDATHLLAFWDGKSKGTGHMIDLGRQYKLDVKVITYD